jgi:hypothetical protein
MEDMYILYSTVHVLIVAFAMNTGVLMEDTSLPPKQRAVQTVKSIFSSVEAYERQLRDYGSKEINK